MACLVVWLLPRFTSLSHSHNIWANFNPSSSSSLLFLAGLQCFRFGRDMLCSGNVHFISPGENKSLWQCVPVAFPHFVFVWLPIWRSLSSPLTTNWCPVLCLLRVTLFRVITHRVKTKVVCVNAQIRLGELLFIFLLAAVWKRVKTGAVDRSLCGGLNVFYCDKPLMSWK